VKTKAGVLYTFGDPLEIQIIDLAEPQAREVVIRVQASGVCHTDRTMHLGANPLPLPLVLGHEVAGIVESVGSDVTYVQAGDYVSTCASAFCGMCRWCQIGELQHCENKNRARAAADPPRLSLDGQPVEPFVGLGGFAEHVLVHESAVVKIPSEVPPGVGSLLGCAVGAGLGAVRRVARVQIGDTVAVIGCGGVGLNVIQGARLAGAVKIIAIDISETKLQMAELFGATHTVNSNAHDPVGEVRRISDGGVKHVLEVVGISDTMEQGFAMLEEMGTLTMVGVPRPEARMSLPMIELLLEKRVQGTKMGSTRFRQDIPLYASMYLQGRLRLDELVSRSVGLTEVNEALENLDDPRGARTVVVFDQ